MIGKTLGHYRVGEQLGRGGMGEVYVAEDLSLDRKVALKFLPDAFTGDPERMARFEREAKVLASLNHTNIATIYGLDQAEGKRFIVMELVEGETLAQRLSRERLSVDEALGICRQIAEGLEAAHEKGVIHRDLKPANVMITEGNKVKILDFGLAKALSVETQSGDVPLSPTITESMTRPGTILGTAAYMSPEQARGKAVDKRADIWAWGCILYECLTGKRPFKGETVTETVAKILEGTPDWDSLPADTPAMVRSLLRQCLQKDSALRLHEIADARIEMGDLVFQPSATTPFSRPFSSRFLLAAIALSLAAGALIAAFAIWSVRRAPSSLITRSIIRIDPGQWLAGMGRQSEFWRPSRTAIAFSGDGHFIIYSAMDGNPNLQSMPRLYLRRTDQMEAKPIAGTEGGINPFLSPDDRWVGFWAGGKLAKVPVEGGVPAILCENSQVYGATWGPGNNIVFATETQLLSVSADGGKPEVLVAPEKTNGEERYRLPHRLPDGKGVLFTILKENWDTKPSVAILDLDSRKWRVLIEDAADAQYIPTGHAVFLRRGTLMAVPFDLKNLEVTGKPIPVIADVMQAINSTHSTYNTCAGQFSVSNSGCLTYVSGGIVPDMENSLVWVDQRGAAQPVASFKAPFIWPRLSPDGQRIAYATIGSEWRVHVYDVNRGTVIDLDGDGKSNCVTWTTDGKRVIFHWWKSGRPNLYWQPSDASTAMERLTTSEYYHWTGSLSQDGTTLAFVENSPEVDILLLDLKSRRITPFIKSKFIEGYPAFSPDGRWLAYSSDESGREEVYVRPFPNPGGKWKISLDGGTEPLWARNGKQLFYRWQDQVWAMDVRTEEGFTASRPRLLFEQPGFRMSNPLGCWDISLDGQRFLMVQLDQRKPQPVTEMILVQNWFEELKRLLSKKNK